MADVVFQAIERHYAITISKSSETKKYSPIDHVKLFLFLDAPPELRKKQNKETEIRKRAVVTLANSVTATSRKLGLTKPVSQQPPN